MKQTNSIYDQIISRESLWQAWAKVNAKYHNKTGGAGGDGQTVASFAEQADANINRLYLLLQTGGYWPRPARNVDIEKRSGGTRTLTIPSVADRVVQTSASLVLTPRLDQLFEDSSFAYRPGRSVQQAVDRVTALRNQGFRWTVDGDIKTFFDNVPHAPLLKQITVAVPCDKTLKLVGDWLQVYGPHGKGLPQGMPLSPLLSNLYLDQIDEAIESHGVRLVRFADDFLLLTKSELAAQGALGKMAQLLEKAGLHLNPAKTAIRSFEESTHFLGRLFLRSLVMDDILDDAPSTPLNHARTAATSQLDAADPMPSPSGLSSRQRLVYLHTPDQILRARGEGFVVRDAKDQKDLALFHTNWVDGIELGPSTEAEDSAIRLAMAHNIPITYLSSQGEVVGGITGGLTARADLHLAQVKMVLSPEASLDITKRILRGRLTNQHVTLRRLNEHKDRNFDAVILAEQQIKGLAAKLGLQKSIESARGIEGKATSIYWAALSELVQSLSLDLGFHGRVRMPPTDPFNAALSYLSSRLTSDINELAVRAGLHPGFGSLHSSMDGRNSLCLDLIEEFRASVIEGGTFTMFSRKRLRPEHFFSQADNNVKILPEGFRVMLREYEARMRTTFKHAQSGKTTDMRGVIEGQIQLYKRHVLGLDQYQSYERG